MSFYLLLPCVSQHRGSASPAHRVLPWLQGGGNSWRVLPVKRRLLSTVKGILQLLDEISLPRQSEKALFLQPPLSDEVHTLLHQHGSQAVPIALLVPHCVFQLLPKNTCTKRELWLSSASETHLGSPRLLLQPTQFAGPLNAWTINLLLS